MAVASREPASYLRLTIESRKQDSNSDDCASRLGGSCNEGTVMRNVQHSSEPSAIHSWKMDPSDGGNPRLALLGMVSHDLRQPLQIVQSTYELLRSRAHTTSEQAWLDRGQFAIDRLVEQLDRLLATLHFYEHTNTLELSSVAVAPLLFGLRAEYAEAALERRIDMRICATNAWVLSNPVLLGGILGNLLTNAIKYTEPGGRILVGCRRAGARVRIEVHDTGIGIPSQQLPRIFDAFERLVPVRGEGLGVGLFVVRRALEALGHGIEVSSAVSWGSRFSIIAAAAEKSTFANDIV
jgi:two-component system, OmpR family, phosphate regulon sensor histidine kinase PhoR